MPAHTRQLKECVMEAKTTDHSLITLIRELRDEMTTLVRQEIALAQAETAEKAARMGRNIAYIGAGGAVAYAGFVLLLGLRDLLAMGIVKAGADATVATLLASFIVAIVIGVVGWVLISKGKKALAEEGLIPRKTVESLKKDQQLIKQKFART